MKTPQQRSDEFQNRHHLPCEEYRKEFIRHIREAEEDARKDENEACLKVISKAAQETNSQEAIIWLLRAGSHIRSRVAPPNPLSPFGCGCWQLHVESGNWIRIAPGGYTVFIGMMAKCCDQCGWPRVRA